MIRGENLCKFYGDRLVFRDTFFEIRKGEICFVLGPNGCGKSTLLRIIAGLASPTKGKIEMDVGKEEIGYIGHRPYLYRGLTAVENLDFWNRLYRRQLDQHELMDFLSITGLAPFAHERVSRFSRGMVQRLNLARLMVLDPEIYLLDEPSSGLDESSRRFLCNFIGEKRIQGKTILWVTHDRIEWEQKDRCLLWFQGDRFIQQRVEPGSMG